MQVDIVNGHLEVTESETDPWMQKRERLALPYAVMRSALLGGHGTSLTAIDHHTRIETGNGKLAEVKAAMETDYEKAMKALERYWGNEVDVTEDLS